MKASKLGKISLVRRFGLIVACCLTLGCTAQYAAKSSSELFKNTGLSDRTRIERSEQWVMEPSSRIYVAMPRSGKEIGELQHQLSKNLARGLEFNFAEIILGSGALALKDALKEAKANGSSYLIFPRLAATQDGINSYQEYDERFFKDDKKFGFDRLNVQLQIYDAISGRFLDRVNIESRSGWFSIYSRSPEELMAGAFQQTSELLAGRVK